MVANSGASLSEYSHCSASSALSALVRVATSSAGAAETEPNPEATNAAANARARGFVLIRMTAILPLGRGAHADAARRTGLRREGSVRFERSLRRTNGGAQCKKSAVAFVTVRAQPGTNVPG